MAARGDATREKILAVAEALFAREGVDRVTLRQIGRAARQRNVAAVQYHFGSKEKLLAEILERHLAGIDAQRREMLDAQEREGDPYVLHALMQVLVEPLVAELDDPSGRAYLQIQAQRLRAGEMRAATRVMAARISRALGHTPDAPADPYRDRFAVLLLFHALADRAREEQAASARASRDDFTRSLLTALEGIYQPPPAGAEEPQRARA